MIKWDPPPKLYSYQGFERFYYLAWANVINYLGEYTRTITTSEPNLLPPDQSAYLTNFGTYSDYA